MPVSGSLIKKQLEQWLGQHVDDELLTFVESYDSDPSETTMTETTMTDFSNFELEDSLDSVRIIQDTVFVELTATASLEL